MPRNTLVQTSSFVCAAKPIQFPFLRAECAKTRKTPEGFPLIFPGAKIKEKIQSIIRIRYAYHRLVWALLEIYIWRVCSMNNDEKLICSVDTFEIMIVK